MDTGLTHAEIAREDGHATPSGTYVLHTEIPRWAFYDIEAHVDWTMRGDRLVIEGIAIWDQVEAEFRILGQVQDGALYGHLLVEALQNEADIVGNRP
ncbi:MAG: hypothetical protein O2782_21355 [bacterium]|nr:hypothetical protein [bacterium]